MKDQTELYVLFTLEAEMLSKRSQTLYLFAQILGHEGRGSLYQELKQRGLILKVEVSEETSYRTLFNALEVCFTLTEHGLHHYQAIIGALFSYVGMMRTAIAGYREDLADFAFYSELKAMSSIGFKYFKVPDALDNVCEIASELIFTSDKTKVLKDVYPDVVLEEGLLSKSYLIALLQRFTLKDAKIVLSGKKILTREHLHTKKGLHVRSEPWFKTQFAVIKKDLKQIEKLMTKHSMHMPEPNPLIPNDFTIKAVADGKSSNGLPLLVRHEKNR